MIFKENCYNYHFCWVTQTIFITANKYTQAMYLKKYHTDPFKTDKKFESYGINIDIIYIKTTKTVKKNVK